LHAPSIAARDAENRPTCVYCTKNPRPHQCVGRFPGYYHITASLLPSVNFTKKMYPPPNPGTQNPRTAPPAPIVTPQPALATPPVASAPPPARQQMVPDFQIPSSSRSAPSSAPPATQPAPI